MTDTALWDRSLVLTNALRWREGRHATQREQLLDELVAVITELRLRGTQLTML
jgi:hypothetical protein